MCALAIFGSCGSGTKVYVFVCLFFGLHRKVRSDLEISFPAAFRTALGSSRSEFTNLPESQLTEVFMISLVSQFEGCEPRGAPEVRIEGN